ncbi:hypothetical protein BIY24_15850 [Halobacteriovorax marinus]|uniref:Flagellar protein FlgJ N-terminal domain-containing protein n=1 Tax=Halobacteriovorax marinus (strain ATCC BAA-682 / DSM 15412 / SJ) TaxID=862908 RepID=E1X129_HALMS|nr:hypothetical protein [Halobacteriovorax marinus]ATH09359.1 hypothetical protein BIY24_15850 [Halobacteriovorax marinus]CBW28099.1 hypothetical protein BMS_3356 [Halobacteriovorax marinus SJ]
MSKINNSIPVNQPVSSKTENKKYIPKPYLDAARGMEKQFIKLMIDEMKKTAGAEQTSTGMDYYMDLQNEERSKAMVNRNQVGLQDLILDRIYPENKRNPYAYNAYLQQTNQMNRPKVEMQNAHVTKRDEVELYQVNKKNIGSNGLGQEAHRE